MEITLLVNIVQLNAAQVFKTLVCISFNLQILISRYVYISHFTDSVPDRTAPLLIKVGELEKLKCQYMQARIIKLIQFAEIVQTFLSYLIRIYQSCFVQCTLQRQHSLIPYTRDSYVWIETLDLANSRQCRSQTAEMCTFGV